MHKSVYKTACVFPWQFGRRGRLHHCLFFVFYEVRGTGVRLHFLIQKKTRSMCLRVYILLVLAQAGRSSFTFGCLRTVLTSGMGSGKPRCPCGNAFLFELSSNMLITWPGFESERWFRFSNRQDFLFCKSCRESRWPQDSRSQGHCRPNASAWRAW